MIALAVEKAKKGPQRQEGGPFSRGLKN